MDWTEQSSLDWLSAVKKLAGNKYRHRSCGEHKYLENASGVIFNICTLGNEAILAEYANNEKEAEINFFEDGDLFYLSDYDNAEALFQALCLEIDNVIPTIDE